jgi:ubiquinone/menaquinone biosynthesis C-methylase UbiE
MAGYVEREAAKIGVAARSITGTAEELPFAMESVDAVMSSLCSVPDVARVLREVRRVLKPGGRFVFIEHVAAQEGTIRRRVQHAVRPVWSLLGDGCVPDRETWKEIEGARFQAVELKHFRAPLLIAVTHVAVTAVR